MPLVASINPFVSLCLLSCLHYLESLFDAVNLVLGSRSQVRGRGQGNRSSSKVKVKCLVCSGLY